jgi:hypothetical protein
MMVKEDDTGEAPANRGRGRGGRIRAVTKKAGYERIYPGDKRETGKGEMIFYGMNFI